MSKLKSDLIAKTYKDNYLCKKNHNLKWTGGQYVFSSDLTCDKCGKPSSLKHPIRWKCSECNVYFCSKCYELILDKICPQKHRYKFTKDGLSEVSERYTCDQCYEYLPSKDSVLYDKDCNITLCPKCYCSSLDIPNILED